MKSKAISLAATIVFVWGLPPVSGVWAQGGWKWRSVQERGLGLGRLYDPRTVQTITGKVTAVDTLATRKGGAYGWRRATLETDQGALPVILGPAWFLEKQKFNLAPGDTLEVQGSRITFEERPCLLAAQVKKGKQNLTLRDKAGLPAWGGPRRR